MSARVGGAGVELTIELTRPVPAELADELARRVYFVSEAITDFLLDQNDDGAVRSVLVRSDGAVPGTVLAEKLRRVVDAEVLSQLTRPAKVVWRSATARSPREDVFEQLLALGAATQAGEGQIALGEPVLGLVDRLDGLVREIAVVELGAEEWRYPTLIPTTALQRSGYFEAFPHHVMLATRLPGDTDVGGSWRRRTVRTRAAPCWRTATTRTTACRRRCAITRSTSTPGPGSPRRPPWSPRVGSRFGTNPATTRR
jgi:hypothetical protein